MYIGSAENSREIGKRKGFFWKKMQRRKIREKWALKSQKPEEFPGEIDRFSVLQLNKERLDSAQA
jgi:hypothetical protein